MKNYIITLVILTMFVNCSKDMDSEVYLSESNFKNNLNAEILLNGTSANYLTDGKHYLKITNVKDSISNFIDFDLLDGQGGYESGIVNIRWLSDSTLFIERYLYDQKQNLIYNLVNLKFVNIKDSIPLIKMVNEHLTILSDYRIVNLDSLKISNILSRLKDLPIKYRYEALENNQGNVYKFAENIFKSQLNDTLKIKFYLSIQPLFPNNAEMGSVLGYDIIKDFNKYKDKPLDVIINSIKNSELKKKVINALSDADMIN